MDAEPLPGDPAGAGHRRAHKRRFAFLRGDAGTSGTYGRHQRPSDQKPAGEREHRPRQGIHMRSVGGGDREHALQRLRNAPGLDDLRAQQHLPGDPGGRAALPAGPVGAIRALCPFVLGNARPPLLRRGHLPGCRPALDQSHRPDTFGDRLLQPQARGLPRRRGRAGRENSEGDSSRHDGLQLPGDRPGLPVQHEGPRLAAPFRGPRHLSCPRHPL